MLSRTLQIILLNLFFAIFIHTSIVFPHNIDSGNPFTTFSVSSLHIIAVATGVKVMPIPIASATSTPGILQSPNHVLTVNHMAQTWWASNLVLGKVGIEYMRPGTQSSVDW
jgi:hypothetical protein